MSRPRSATARRRSFFDRRAFRSIRISLYRHLSAQVGNGRALLPAMEDFAARLDRRGNHRGTRVIRDIVRRLMDGRSLSEALAAWAPPSEMLIIASGDQSGDLPRALELAVDSEARVGRIRQAVLGEMTAPFVYLLSLWAMLYIIGAKVVPQLAVMLPPARWQGAAYLLYLMGVISTGWAAWAAPLSLLAVAGAVMWGLPRWVGRGRIHAERFIPWSVYRDLQGYTWLMSFTALMRTGMDNVQILSRQITHATPWLAERLSAAKRRMEDGWNLAEALAGVRARGTGGATTRRRPTRRPQFGFPNPDMIDDINAFVDFPDFPDRIGKVADLWADALERRMKSLGKAMNFATTLAMAVVFIIVQVGANAISSQLSSGIGGFGR